MSDSESSPPKQSKTPPETTITTTNRINSSCPLQVKALTCLLVSEPRLDEGYDRGSRTIAQKVAMVVQAVSVRCGEASNVHLTLEGSVVRNCELYVPYRIER